MPIERETEKDMREIPEAWSKGLAQSTLICVTKCW